MNWQTILAIDSDRWAAETYRANFSGVRVECGPVADYIDALPLADVVLGGPPCQPFSDAGENEGEHDDRDCIPDFIAAVRKVRPRQFLMENVRGLLKEKHLGYFGRALAEMESLGYVVQYRLLDAASFGVPQFRERVWVWGIRSDVAAKHCWPKPTHAWPPPQPCMFGAALLPGVTVGQALGLDGELHRKRGAGMLERSGGRRDHPTTEPSPSITAAFALGGGGGLFLKGKANGEATDMRGMRQADRAGAGANRPGEDRGGAGGGCGLSPGLPSEGEIFIRHPRVTGGREFIPAEEPSRTLTGSRASEVQIYRWSDAMLEKHPPASPASPAPTVQAKWFKGGAEGLLRVDGASGWSGQRILEDGRPAPTVPGGTNQELRRVDAPSHTVSGQSREPIQGWKSKGYVRRLTPLECARLQSVPDDFRWPEKITKTAAYKVVGNGWASLMAWRMSEALAAADPQGRTVIDLFCGGGLGACGWHGRYWSYAASAESEVA